MIKKRNSSNENNIKKKLKKVNLEDTIDYTKSLTSEDVETIDSINEQELDNIDIPEKIKSAKKAQGIKKKVPKNDKENNASKKTKGKPDTTSG